MLSANHQYRLLCATPPPTTDDTTRTLRLNWVTPMGMTLRTIALTLNEMKIKPAEVFRGKILFK